MTLQEYFDKMSEIARRYERMGSPDSAQQVRNRRNDRWNYDSRAEVEQQQILSRSRSWR